MNMTLLTRITRKGSSICIKHVKDYIWPINLKKKNIFKEALEAINLNFLHLHLNSIAFGISFSCLFSNIKKALKVMGKINWIKAKKFITKAFGQVRERKRGKMQFAIECVINIHCRGHKLSANCFVCSAQNCATSVLFKLADFEFLELHMSRFHGKGECFIIRNWNYWAGDKTSRLVKLIRVVLSAKSASHSCIKNKRKCFTQHRAHTRSGCFIHKTSNLLKIHSQPQGPRSLFASTHILCFFLLVNF